MYIILGDLISGDGLTVSKLNHPVPVLVKQTLEEFIMAFSFFTLPSITKHRQPKPLLCQEAEKQAAAFTLQ
jgi:hypothetical protein